MKCLLKLWRSRMFMLSLCALFSMSTSTCTARGNIMPQAVQSDGAAESGGDYAGGDGQGEALIWVAAIGLVAAMVFALVHDSRKAREWRQGDDVGKSEPANDESIQDRTEVTFDLDPHPGSSFLDLPEEYDADSVDMICVKLGLAVRF